MKIDNMRVIFICSVVLLACINVVNAAPREYMPGQPREISSEIMDEFEYKIMNEAINEGFPNHRLLKLVSATKQVVAGLMYRFTVDIKKDEEEKRVKLTLYLPPGSIKYSVRA